MRPSRSTTPFPSKAIRSTWFPQCGSTCLLELPDDVLCRDDCAGICPVCGIDRNTGACDCDTTVRDDRWAALDGLQLDETDDVTDDETDDVT